MQFTILIYHYTGASTESTIYGVIRVIVAAYLFMTGFGHTTYFLKKKDYSFKRLVGVLIRLNLLSCVLPFMMGTHYLFYYFAPLCSYWFLVVYGTMRAGEKYNSNIIFLLVKIFLASILSAAFTNFPGLLETIFDVFGFVAKTEWDATEWRSRVSLDMWIVFVGMLVAIVSVRVNEGSSYTSAKWWISARRYAIASSAVALPLFFLFQMTRETKYVYNAYHPYVSFIPILAFIVLRNATPRLRNAHSRVFAWLGNMSLETFTLQFHIWMAADTKGLLDLGAFGMTGRVKNFVFSTILFFYASYHVAGAKEVLTRWIIGEPVESMAGASQQTGLPTLRDRNKDITVEETVPLAWRGSNEGLTFEELNGDDIRYVRDEDQIGYWGNLKFRMAVILFVVWGLNLVWGLNTNTCSPCTRLTNEYRPIDNCTHCTAIVNTCRTSQKFSHLISLFLGCHCIHLLVSYTLLTFPLEKVNTHLDLGFGVWGSRVGLYSCLWLCVDVNAFEYYCVKQASEIWEMLGWCSFAGVGLNKLKFLDHVYVHMQSHKSNRYPVYLQQLVRKKLRMILSKRFQQP